MAKTARNRTLTWQPEDTLRLALKRAGIVTGFTHARLSAEGSSLPSSHRGPGRGLDIAAASVHSLGNSVHALWGDRLSENFGQRVRRLRESKGLGLRETAKKLSISAAYLSRIETSEERTPPAEKVIKDIANLLEDNFDELMRLAGRIPSDVKDYITMEGMPQFLRTAKDRKFTAKELEQLLQEKKRK